MPWGNQELIKKFSFYMSIPEINEEIMTQWQYYDFFTSDELIHPDNDYQWQSTSSKKRQAGTKSA